MKTVASLHRLLEALEELGRREDGALAGGDGEAFLALEQRVEPLVRRVVSMVADAGEHLDASVRARGRALVENRRERRARLMALLETTRDEIGRLDECRVRARALRPAYTQLHSPRPSAPAFAACG